MRKQRHPSHLESPAWMGQRSATWLLPDPPTGPTLSEFQLFGKRRLHSLSFFNGISWGEIGS